MSAATTQFPTATILAYPRIGRNRELKRALEARWAGRITEAELIQAANDLRKENLARLVELGLNPSDASLADAPSLYDHVLDATILLGAIPPRFAGRQGLDLYFALARGDDKVGPEEMTKWFDTNYHYLVPEIGPDTPLHFADDTVVLTSAEQPAAEEPVENADSAKGQAEEKVADEAASAEAESAPETQGEAEEKVADEVASAEAESAPEAKDASVKAESASEAQEESAEDADASVEAADASTSEEKKPAKSSSKKGSKKGSSKKGTNKEAKEAPEVKEEAEEKAADKDASAEAADASTSEEKKPAKSSSKKGSKKSSSKKGTTKKVSGKKNAGKNK